MKKILSTVLAMFALAAIFAISANAENSSSVVEQNTQLLYNALVAARQQIPQEWLRFPAEEVCRPAVEEAAGWFYDITGGMISEVNIQAQIQLYPHNYISDFYAVVIDQNNQSYTLILDERGPLYAIWDSNRQEVWNRHGGPNLSWWMTLPFWMQCILHVVFFGWIWMR